MHQFNFSFIWKLISIIAAIAFVLLAVIPAFMGKSFLNILETEIGVIAGWLLLLLLYGIFIYLIRHARRS